MKNIVLGLFGVCLVHCGIYGQEIKNIQQPAIGIHVTLNDFRNADSLHPSGKFNYARFGIALNYLKGLTPRTDINATMAGSFLALPGKDKETGSRRLILEADISIREKMILGDHPVVPFLQGGAGISRFDNDYGIFIPAGIGVQVNLPGEAFLLFNTQYRIPVSSGQTGHFYFSMGIAGIIGKKKRFKVRKARPGVVTENTINGLKDSDGDGIADKDDKCPTLPGVLRYQGCPVPDRDGDGVNDEEDKCPDVPGARNNAGCPVIRKDLRRAVELAAKNIFFATDSFTLLPASYPGLDEVSRILNKYPSYTLDISGHTDNSGNADKNQALSDNRAGAVLEYIMIHGGITLQRLSATGYGSSRPVADNASAEGRALNRRVELTLK